MAIGRKAMDHEERRRVLANRRITQLLQRCGNPERYDKEAMHKFREAIHKGMFNEILFDTGLEHRQLEPGVWRTRWEQTDYGSAVDWYMHYARDARWDIVSCGLQSMTQDIIRKVNDTKIDGSFISNFEVWDAPCMYKYGRMGFYCWVELESPYNARVTLTETCE